MGSSTDKNIGVEYEIMKMVPNRLINVIINDLRLFGICSSTELMSLTKRLIIASMVVTIKVQMGRQKPTKIDIRHKMPLSILECL